MGKVLDIGLWGIFGPSPRLLFWEPFILGEVPHIELWAFQAPPGGCYLGKVVDLGLLGLSASIVGKVVDIVGLLGFLASIMGKVLDIAGLLGFLALPLSLPTSRWDLKSERPYILKTSYAKAHFTLGVRAQKTWGQL